MSIFLCYRRGNWTQPGGVIAQRTVTRKREHWVLNPHLILATHSLIFSLLLPLISLSLPPTPSLSHLTIMVILFKRKFPGLACKKLKSHHTIITTTKLSKLKNQHVLGPSEKRGLNWKGGHRETQRSGAEIGSRIFHGNQYRDRKI